MSDPVQSHRRQPTRLPHPWDSPGKNTGVGCHFLLQCMKVKSESEFTQSCLTLRDAMDCSLPGSFIHGIFQARVLEWDAIAFSKQSSEVAKKSQTQVCLTPKPFWKILGFLDFLIKFWINRMAIILFFSVVVCWSLFFYWPSVWLFYSLLKVGYWSLQVLL